MFLRGIFRRNTEAENRRIQKAEQSRETTRSEKFERQRQGGASLDVGLANILRELGIDFFSAEPSYLLSKKVPEVCEGRRVDGFSDQALKFLKETYEIEQVVGPGDKPLLHFKKDKGKDIKMSLIQDIARRTEMPLKQARDFYAALVRQVHRDLRDERRSRLPDLGIIQVKYLPEREAGKKPNPWKKGEIMKVKARPATNKLKFRIAKDLRKYAEEKVEVVKPDKKDKKKKKH